eukprot:12260296-Alexandrium_andersonii.AAC.1
MHEAVVHVAMVNHPCPGLDIHRHRGPSRCWRWTPQALRFVQHFQHPELQLKGLLTSAEFKALDKGPPLLCARITAGVRENTGASEGQQARDYTNKEGMQTFIMQAASRRTCL